MRRRALTAVAVALLASAGVAAAVRPPARAACASLGAHWRCRTVTVPLDPSGHVAGRIRLAVTQYHAPCAHRPAVFAFAGGPGGAAVPKARKYRRLLAPLLRTRDLVLFDERGTGGSGALSCSGVEGRDVLPAGAVAGCARRLGRSAGFYGSARSADDAEAVRRALGVPRVVAYGVSYGTK